MKVSKPLLTCLVLCCCVAGVLVFKSRAAAVPGANKTSVAAHLKGSASAPVRIVEFSDYQCPSCAKAVEAIDKAMAENPGKFSVEYRNFPLPMHQHAFRAAVFAECADAQGKFWPFHDVIFRSQTSWAGMSSVDKYFTDLAIGLGMDAVMLQACVSADAPARKVAADVAAGKNQGVDATPTFFINGKMVVGLKNLKTELGQ